jgi:hypothetical protein
MHVGAQKVDFGSEINDSCRQFLDFAAHVHDFHMYPRLIIEFEFGLRTDWFDLKKLDKTSSGGR